MTMKLAPRTALLIEAVVSLTTPPTTIYRAASEATRRVVGYVIMVFDSFG
jgi:hypothetical protein